jgi:glutamate-ammonia-ligase adenylyltransferase
MVEETRNLINVADLHEEAKAQSLLQQAGFADWKAAWAVFQRIESHGRQGLASIFTYLMSALESAADPERSLINFERFMESYGPKLLTELHDNPRVIEILITLFSTSAFLTEILLRTPDAFEILNDRQALPERKSLEQFLNEALSSYQQGDTESEKLDALRRYQRRQLLRVGVSDFLGLFDLRTVFSQLSRLSIGLVRTCLSLAAQKTGTAPVGFSVLALGKLGGRELNYSSDIDLIFVAKSNPDNYLDLAEKFIRYIAGTTSEGFLYRVDLRLRPWGNDGPLISSFDGYLQYMQKHAQLWEKQAFFKARPIAGDLSLGEELREKIEPLLFSTPADEIRASIFGMKQRTEEFLRDKGRDWGEVKLGEGSIRDIEFIVQSMQLTHPAIRTRATLKAIPLLKEKGLLSPSEMHILMDGYDFLRTIEHYLQVIDYRQTYTLPSDANALNLLARRLGFEGIQAGEQFVKRYEQHCRAIRSIFLKYVGKESADEIAHLPNTSPQVIQHIARMDASYTATFSTEEIKQHVQLIKNIEGDRIVNVDARPLDDSRWRVTVVGYDYLGELSLICGLLFVYGLDILESQVFTYEPLVGDASRDDTLPSQARPYPSFSIDPSEKSLKRRHTNLIQPSRPKIVDVFNVRPIHPEPLISEIWTQYSEDLQRLLYKMQTGQRREARGELAKRVGQLFQGMASNTTTLYPIEIDIDNESSNLYTVLEIGSIDTSGFLYEFSNALAMNHINISRMFVQSIGNRVKDTIYVTDDEGHKITSPEKQRELRAATVLIKHFTHLLPRSSNPEAALLHFREFLGQLFDRPDWPYELVNLEKPEVLDALARLLGVSDFLWDDFLRMQYSNLFPVVRDVNALAENKDYQQLQVELEGLLARTDNWRANLNAFKDREMFRIDMRHILGYSPEYWDFSYELTDLVEVVLSAVYNHCFEEACQEFGYPLLENGEPCPSSLFALGKCGGRELGFASDIELMMIYGGKGWATGKKKITTSNFFEELIRSLLGSILARQEGIFQIDLQLRPYGKAGSLAVSEEAFQRYFTPQGPAWAYERQALVKLRPITGDKVFNEKICKLRDQYIYTGEPFNITAMRAMRERQIRHFVTAGTFNAKYSPGGLVDLEYLVQGLQISYGARIPSLRSTNIRLAMKALAEAGILSTEDFTRLRKAHTFLSWLIDSLRVVRGNSRDVDIPSTASEEFYFLTRRLRYGSDTDQLKEDLIKYPLDVQEISLRLLPNP